MNHMNLLGLLVHVEFSVLAMLAVARKTEHPDINVSVGIQYMYINASCGN